MDEEDEPKKPDLYVTDFSQSVTAEWREKQERDRREARSRYRDLLTAELDARGTANPSELADAVLEAIFTWCIVGSGDECSCGCHPSLPSSDLHGYGFECICRRSPEERVKLRREMLDRWRAFGESPEGQALAARDRAERAAVRQWVDDQPGVAVSEFGGEMPERWYGEVDGHSFYFRERHGEWRIELDLRPSGRFVKVVRGSDDAGNFITEDQEIDDGDIIATGTIEAPEYGSSLVERGQFIVNTIRRHLTSKACALHGAEEVRLMEERLQQPVVWCPSCGTRLADS